HVVSTSNSYITPSGEQSEIIFVGTGTSEGILRVGCLTDPCKNCSVCKKAVEPCNKKRDSTKASWFITMDLLGCVIFLLMLERDNHGVTFKHL
ncbi:hypothetical protein RDABS01_024654, partial [Bienertia sinuspersici]